jgi:hypothetical protein
MVEKIFANFRVGALEHLPDDIGEPLAHVLAEQATLLLAEYGSSAFEGTFEAAVAHEVGHAIVGAHDGLGITSVSVWRRHDGRWVGRTDEAAHHWQITPDMPLRDRFVRAGFITAGEVGEAVLALTHYRKGTSLDELVLSQWIIAGTNLSGRTGWTPAGLWQSVRNRAAGVIRHNEAVARQMVDALGRTKSLRRTPLQSLLEQVQKIQNDWPADCDG